MPKKQRTRPSRLPPRLRVSRWRRCAGWTSGALKAREAGLDQEVANRVRQDVEARLNERQARLEASFDERVRHGVAAERRALEERSARTENRRQMAVAEFQAAEKIRIEGLRAQANARKDLARVQELRDQAAALQYRSDGDRMEAVTEAWIKTVVPQEQFVTTMDSYHEFIDERRHEEEEPARTAPARARPDRDIDR